MKILFVVLIALFLFACPTTAPQQPSVVCAFAQTVAQGQAAKYATAWECDQPCMYNLIISPLSGNICPSTTAKSIGNDVCNVIANVFVKVGNAGLTMKCQCKHPDISAITSICGFVPK